MLHGFSEAFLEALLHCTDTFITSARPEATDKINTFRIPWDHADFCINFVCALGFPFEGKLSPKVTEEVSASCNTGAWQV